MDMSSWEKSLSSLLFVLGITLVLSGAGLWVEETLIPAWQFRSADTDGDGVIVVDTLDRTATPPADTQPASPSPTSRTSPQPTNTVVPASPTTEETGVTTSKPRIPSPSTPAMPTATPTPSAPPPAAAPPSRLTIPSIDLDTEVVLMGWTQKETESGTTYSDWILPEYAAGWHRNSALPGHGGNVVLSGHNNVYGEVFRYLEDVDAGDQLTLFVDDTAYRYEVAEKYIIKEKGVPYEQRLENAQFMSQTDDERLTLIGCWPYETNTHRLVLVARPLSEQNVALRTTQ